MKALSREIKDGLPYLGWSAGANIACPTLMTTNDMPVIAPKSFTTLNLIPFQINPHYNRFQLPNYSGESRDDRIREFLGSQPG